MSYSFLSSFLQMLASLSVVLGLIFLAQYIFKRYSGKAAVGLGSGYIRVIENRFLGPRRSLMLVEVGGEYLLLGVTNDRISLIKQVDMVETGELIPDESFSTVLQGKVLQMFKKSG